MMRKYIACFIWVLLLGAGPAGAALQQLLAEHGYQRIQMTKLSTRHDTVDVVINGQHGVFVVDTGAVTLINQDLKEKYRIHGDKLKTVKAAGAGGLTEADFYPLSELEIAGLSLTATQVALTDLSAVTRGILNATGVLVDGIIGYDLLVSYGAVIDAGENNLFLQTTHGQPGSGEAASLLLKQHLVKQAYRPIPLFPIIFPTEDMEYLAAKVAVNGVTGTMIIDSGAGRSMLHSDRVEKFQLKATAQANTLSSSGAGGVFGIQAWQLASMKLSATAIHVNQVFAADLTALIDFIEQHAQHVIDGVVGQDWMMQYEAVIDLAGHRLYLKSVD